MARDLRYDGTMLVKDIWDSIPKEYHARCYAFVGDPRGSRGFGPPPTCPLWFEELTNEQQRLLFQFRKMHYLEVFHGGFKITGSES